MECDYLEVLWSTLPPPSLWHTSEAGITISEAGLKNSEAGLNISEVPPPLFRSCSSVHKIDVNLLQSYKVMWDFYPLKPLKYIIQKQRKSSKDTRNFEFL